MSRRPRRSPSSRQAQRDPPARRRRLPRDGQEHEAADQAHEEAADSAEDHQGPAVLREPRTLPFRARVRFTLEGLACSSLSSQPAPAPPRSRPLRAGRRRRAGRQHRGEARRAAPPLPHAALLEEDDVPRDVRSSSPHSRRRPRCSRCGRPARSRCRDVGKRRAAHRAAVRRRRWRREREGHVDGAPFTAAYAKGLLYRDQVGSALRCARRRRGQPARRSNPFVNGGQRPRSGAARSSLPSRRPLARSRRGASPLTRAWRGCGARRWHARRSAPATAGDRPLSSKTARLPTRGWWKERPDPSVLPGDAVVRPPPLRRVPTAAGRAVVARALRRRAPGGAAAMSVALAAVLARSSVGRRRRVARSPARPLRRDGARRRTGVVPGALVWPTAGRQTRWSIAVRVAVGALARRPRRAAHSHRGSPDGRVTEARWRSSPSRTARALTSWCSKIQARSTFDNARLCAAPLAKGREREVVLVTCDFHVARSLAQFHAHEISAVAVPSHLAGLRASTACG